MVTSLTLHRPYLEVSLEKRIMGIHFKNFKRLIGRSKRLPFLVITIVIMSLVACSGDDDAPEFDFPLEGTNLSIADISGNWTATSAEFQGLGVPGGFIEIVGADGSVTLNIQNNGRFTSTISLPEEGSQSFSGQMGFSGSQLVLLDDVDEPGDEAFIIITLTPEDILQLSGILEFDFDGDGNFDDTDVDLIMTR
ncbi:MAG: hypothetical protein AAF348_12675 [Bacteroidota bacterium]